MKKRNVLSFCLICFREPRSLHAINVATVHLQGATFRSVRLENTDADSA